MPKANPVSLKRPLPFDEAMRKLMNIPPPPSGKKARAKRKAGSKKKSRSEKSS